MPLHGSFLPPSSTTSGGRARSVRDPVARSGASTAGRTTPALRGGATPPWAEVQDGKLVRYIVHADRRIARLHESTGRGAEAPTTLGGDTSHGGDIVAIRDRDVMGLLGWLAVLATLGGVLLGGLLHGARSRWRPRAWAAAIGPRAAS